MIRTEKGQLLDGIPFGDVLHREFELRLPVLADTGQALDDAEDRFGTVEGFAADAFYRAAVMSSALVSLGDIPKDELTAELLYGNLTSDDYDVLQQAREKLKAKRSGGNPGSPDSASPSLPSDVAESAKNA
jgi:hypothetical protein